MLASTLFSLTILFAGLHAGNPKLGKSCNLNVPDDCGRGLRCIGNGVCFTDGTVFGSFGDRCGSRGSYACGDGLTCYPPASAAVDAGGYCIADGSRRGKWGEFCGARNAFTCGKGLTCVPRLPGAKDAGGYCRANGRLAGGEGDRCDFNGGYKCTMGYICLPDLSSSEEGARICVKGLVDPRA